MRYKLRENGKVIFYHHAEFVDAPVTPDRANKAPVEVRGAGAPDSEALLVRQAFQGMGYFGWPDAAGAAGRAHIAGKAEPHGIAGKHFIPLAGPNHGDYLAGRVFHLSRHRATAGTGTALDTGEDMLAAGGCLNLIQKSSHTYFHVTRKLILRQIDGKKSQPSYLRWFPLHPFLVLKSRITKRQTAVNFVVFWDFNQLWNGFIPLTGLH